MRFAYLLPLVALTLANVSRSTPNPENCGSTFYNSCSSHHGGGGGGGNGGGGGGGHGEPKCVTKWHGAKTCTHGDGKVCEHAWHGFGSPTCTGPGGKPPPCVSAWYRTCPSTAGGHGDPNLHGDSAGHGSGGGGGHGGGSGHGGSGHGGSGHREGYGQGGYDRDGAAMRNMFGQH